MADRYISRPREVEAYHYSIDDGDAGFREFLDEDALFHNTGRRMLIILPRLVNRPDHSVRPGEWLVRDGRQGYVVYSNEEFEAEFEEAPVAHEATG